MDNSQKFGFLRSDTNEKFDAVNQRVDNLQTSVNDLKDMMTQMQLQMQRNHYQLMMAILSHSHRADRRPVFDLPPDLESDLPDPGD